MHIRGYLGRKEVEQLGSREVLRALKKYMVAKDLRKEVSNQRRNADARCN